MVETIIPEIKELVFQKDPLFLYSTIPTVDGGELNISKDGCTLISLYNALRLCGYENDFDAYCVELANGGCFDSNGQINWLSLNKLQLNLRFVWMQDNEIPNCERVNIDRLKEYELFSEGIAILKVQSLYGQDRRHFMVFIELVDEKVICLESSGISGKAEIRSILPSEVLGVRYLKKSI